MLMKRLMNVMRRQLSQQNQSLGKQLRRKVRRILPLQMKSVQTETLPPSALGLLSRLRLL